jgi:hypothetical protein
MTLAATADITATTAPIVGVRTIRIDRAGSRIVVIIVVIVVIEGLDTFVLTVTLVNALQTTQARIPCRSTIPHHTDLFTVAGNPIIRTITVKLARITAGRSF